MPLLPGAVISDDEDDQEEPMTPVKEKIVLTSIEVGKYCFLVSELSIPYQRTFRCLVNVLFFSIIWFLQGHDC